MKLQKSEQKEGINFPITPAGTHVARCVQVIDKGTHLFETQWGDKIQRKLFVLYELPLKLNTFTDKEGNEKTLPFGMPKTYTNSTFEKASLYQHLEAWFGDVFTDEPTDFDLKNMLDKPCLVTVAHKDGTDKRTGKPEKYAVVAAVTALPEGMECPPRVNPLIFLDLDNFDQAVWDGLSDNMKAGIQTSDEYKILTGQVGQRPEIQDRNQDAPLVQSENPAPAPDLDMNGNPLPF